MNHARALVLVAEIVLLCLCPTRDLDSRWEDAGLICHRRGFVFLHIPKTAGTSVRRALGGFLEPLRLSWLGDGYKHMTARHVAERYGNRIFERYFTFCFVRNPWERMVSFYTYHRQGNGSALAQSTIRYCRSHAFTEFVEQYINRDLWQGPQLDWITLDDGTLAVDFVGRTERLQQDWLVVCERVGLPAVELPRRNGSRHGSYTSYYDARTRALVERAHARDIEAFGYRFGD